MKSGARRKPRELQTEDQREKLLGAAAQAATSLPPSQDLKGGTRSPAERACPLRGQRSSAVLQVRPACCSGAKQDSKQKSLTEYVGENDPGNVASEHGEESAQAANQQAELEEGHGEDRCH